MVVKKMKSLLSYLLSMVMVVSMVLTSGVVSARTITATTTLEDFETPGTTYFHAGADPGNLPLTLTNVDTTTNVTYQVYSGTHSLKVDFDGAGDGYLNLFSNDVKLEPGSILTYHIYIPDGANISKFSMFSMDGNWGNWTGSSDTACPEANKWTTISYTIPSSYTTPNINMLGLHVATTGKGSFYVDRIEKTGITNVLDNPPTAANVKISGAVMQGFTLNGLYDYVNSDSDNIPEGKSTYRWFKSDSADGVFQPIDGATNSSYTLTKDDVNKYFKFEVTPQSSVAVLNGTSQAYLSAAVGPIRSNVLSSGKIITPGYNSLQDITIFKNVWSDGWQSGKIETEEWDKVNHYNRPATVTDAIYSHNGLLSLKMHQTGSFTGELAFNGWASMDLSAYYLNGKLEFDVVGQNGGESMKIRFGYTSDNPKVEPKWYTLKLNDDSKITDSGANWQHVSITLKDLMDSTVKDYNLVSRMGFSNANDNEQTMYFNNIRVTTVDAEKSFPEIKVNQLGYFPNAEKHALISGFNEMLTADVGTNYQLVSADTNQTVFTGKLSTKSDYDELSGEKVLLADFTQFNTPGTYYIKVDGIPQQSLTFKIGDDVYNQLLEDSVKYYCYQRSGIDLDAKYAGKFAHKAFFMGDNARDGVDETKIPLASSVGDTVNGEVYVNAPKGWFDAGDFSKDVENGAITVKKLLYAFEQYPQYFTDNINIPESGNGIPDVLDEAKWELDFFLSMQEKATGGFYNAVVAHNSPYNVVSQCNVDPFKPDTYGAFKREIADYGVNGEKNVKSTATTAIAVSALAQAAYIYKKYDADYSNKLLEAAKSGWLYLKANPNEIKVVGSPYIYADDKSTRIAAAAALFRATGDQEYNKYVLDNYKQFLGKIASTPKSDDADYDVHSLNSDYCNDIATTEDKAVPLYDYITAQGADTQVADFLKSQYVGYDKAIKNRASSSAWENTIGANLYWGSNGQVNAQAGSHLSILGNIFGTYNAETRNTLIKNMNYLLGVNPLRFSFVSGEGQDSWKGIFSGIFNSDSIDEVPAGYLSGGVNRYQGSKISKFPGKCFADNRWDWTSNEHCINYQGNFVFAIAAAKAAGLLQEPVVLSVAQTSTTTPGTTTTSGTTTSATPTPAPVQKITLPDNAPEAAKKAVDDIVGILNDGNKSADSKKQEIQNKVDAAVAAVSKVEVMADDLSGSEVKLKAEDLEQQINQIVATIDALAKQAAAGGVNVKADKKLSIDMTNVNADKITLPQSILSKIRENGIENIEVKTSSTKIVLKADTIAAGDTKSAETISLKADKFTVSADPVIKKELAEKLNDTSAIEVSAFADSKQIHNLNSSSPAEVTVPYELKAGQSEKDIAIYYINDNGNVEKMNSAIIYDSNAKNVTFTTTHFSKFAVGQKVTFNSFTDIASVYSEAQEAIDAMYAAGIVNGKSNTTFEPSANITRAEFTKMLMGAFGIKAEGESTFNDVSKDVWYSSYLAAAQKAGIVNGVGNGNFAPDKAITRQDMCVMLENAMKALNKTVAAPDSNTLSKFTDGERIASYAKDAVASIAQIEVIKGRTDGSFGAQDNAIRADVSTIIYRVYNNIK